MVSQKMKATASNKGFTLVELIVVITILAILGTIGFISIQGYSAQSRDSKRTSDLRALSSALTIKATDGIALTSFVTSTQAATLSGANFNVGSGFSLAGTGVGYSPLFTDYLAGTPNFTALGVSSSNFKDTIGTNVDYRIGTTTRDGGAFQIAATLEGAGIKQALVTGNYTARAGIVFVASGASTTGGSSTSYTVSNLSGSGIGYFNKGDIVYLGTIGSGSITAVNGDGKGFSITLNAAASTGSTTVNLGGTGSALTEISGLIASGSPASATVPTSNGSTTNLPY